jgi:hypothetical protein
MARVVEIGGVTIEREVPSQFPAMIRRIDG